MGLGDINRTVVTSFVMDTTKVGPALDDAKAKSEGFGESLVSAATKANSGLNGLFETVGKLGSAFEGLKKIGEFVWEGYKDGLEDARNAMGAMGTDIEALTRASHGLVTENDLVAFSAKAMQSAYHNSQADLENAEKAMLALERRGVSVADATNAVTAALVEGKTRGLEPYGIVVDRHIKDLQSMAVENMTLAQKEELHGRALKALAELSKDVVDGEDAVGDSMQRSIVKASNAWDDMKKSIGRLATAMEPLIGALARMLDLITGLINLIPDNPLGGGSQEQHVTKYQKQAPLYWDSKAKDYIPDGDGKADFQAEWAKAHPEEGIAASNAASAQGEVDLDDPKYLKDAAAEQFKAKLEAGKKATEAYVKAQEEAKRHWEELAKQHKEQAKKLADTSAKSSTDDLVKQLEDEGVGSATYGTGATTSLHDSASTMNDELTKSFGASSERAGTGADAAGYKKFQTQKTNSFLEKTFGKVGEFDAYKKAFDTLSGAVGASMDAWVSGSMSAGAAFKKFIADALKGLASQMLIESLKNAAYALGSLAAENYAGAAKYAIAAAEFAAAGVAAGVAAKEMGAGASASAPGGGGSASAGGGSSSSGGSTTGTPNTGPIIVYGDSFSDDSPRMRAIKAQKMVTKALGSAAMSNS